MVAAMRVQSLFDLAGRVAIVTGGGTHLGRAMAETLAELGAAVYLASRDAARCERVAAELRAAGLDATGLGVDVTTEAEVEALVDRVMSEHGRLDVMVCNAGGAFTTTYLPDASIDELRQALELNVTGTYVCAQAAARVMIPGAGAASSPSARSTAPSARTTGSTPGSTTSGRARRTRRQRARSSTSRGRSRPSWPSTASRSTASPRARSPRAGTDPEFVERCRLANPLARTGTPADLKGAVALLASDAGAWITGHNLVVDGGWSVW